MINLILSIPYFSTLISKACTAVNIKFNNEHEFYPHILGSIYWPLILFQTSHADLGEIKFQGSFNLHFVMINNIENFKVFILYSCSFLFIIVFLHLGFYQVV